MNVPEVTVVLPVRDGARHLGEAVQSILSQTFTDFELLLIDDGSIDESPKVCAEMQAADPRVRLAKGPGEGLSAALNVGVGLARAPLLARMDADDVAHPERLARQVDHLNRWVETAVLGTWVEVVNDELELLRTWEPPGNATEVAALMEHGCAVAHPTAMMRTEVIRELGGYRVAFAASQDYDLWLRVLDAGYTIQNLPVHLLKYREHQGSISRNKSHDQEVAAFAARISHRLRLGGAAHTFADGPELESNLMWDEVPLGGLLDLKAAWGLAVRDSQVGEAFGWQIEAVCELLRSTRRGDAPAAELCRAWSLLASDARRRGDSAAIRWYLRAVAASPLEAGRQLFRGVRRRIVRMPFRWSATRLAGGAVMI